MSRKEGLTPATPANVPEFSSIVFFDESDILKDNKYPDIQIAYKGKSAYSEGRFELKCQQ